VDRITATMMFASQNRSRAIRRLLPLNRSARDSPFWRAAGNNAGEGQICCGGAPARRGELGHDGADRAVTDKEDTQASATISAHKNPASSRAIAAATTERTFLCKDSWWNREERRTWAVHERASVSGGTPR